MNDFERSDIERLEYWQGQLLRAEDFEKGQSADEQLRWWHNRSLHQAYGVSEGLSVELEAGNLRVNCGVAYDRYGRELLLPTPVLVTLPKAKAPPKAGQERESLALILHWGEPGDGAAPVDCVSGRTQHRRAQFAWAALARLDSRAGVPIAVVDWEVDGFVLDSRFVPPASRPIARPHLGSGATPAGGTVWETWSEHVQESGGRRVRAIGVQTRIDTSASGFAEVPVYIAQLHRGALPRRLTTPICHIHQPEPASFVFRIWFPRARALAGLRVFVDLSRDLPLTLQDLGWFVTWTGGVSYRRTELERGASHREIRAGEVC